MAGARTPLLAASLGAALGLAVGATVGLRLAPDAHAPVPGATPPAGGAPPAQRDARLRELEAEVARWRGAYEELARERDAAAAAKAAGAPPQAGPPQPTEPEVTASQTFDAASLVARGYTEEEVRRLRERYESYELELLYLNDRARREGWRQQPRFLAESRRLAEALQAELGDRDYDAVLYGSGRTNRVQVAGVLAGSAAERAGLRNGDEVISYDGRRVFEAQTLVRATSQGSPGEQTELRVRRGGEELRILLPRGPIGIRLQPARVPPEGFL